MFLFYYQASVERGGWSRWSKEKDGGHVGMGNKNNEEVVANSHEQGDSFEAKRRQAGALLKDLDLSLGQLENMVETKKKLSIEN